MSKQDPINLRASAMPMGFLCAASLRPGSVLMNESNDGAYSGTATHEVLRPLPSTGRIDWDGIDEIAQRYNADPDETRLLSALGAKLWNKVRDSFQGAMVEVAMEYELAPGVVLTGHGDLIALAEKAIRVGDWKTGRKDNDHSNQLKAYASMALLSSTDIQEATGTGLWVREQEIENYTLDRAAAQRWIDDVVARILTWDGVYRPGRHCLHCPRSFECEAHNALIRRDIAVMADVSTVSRVECELELMSAEEIVSVLQRASLVEKYADRVRDAIRNHVKRNGDVVANGVRLTIVEQNNRELDPQIAWPLLEKLGFQDEDFAAAMELKISRVEKLVKARAEKGKGASAVRELTKLLREAGAISLKPIEKLEEKRA